MTARASDPSAAVAVIREGSAPVTFIQTWTINDRDRQRQWLATMTQNIHLLRGQPGFVSMSLHSSLDGQTIVVYAQWASAEELEAAVTNPSAAAAHDQLAALGTASGSLYDVAAVYGPLATGEPTVDRS